MLSMMLDSIDWRILSLLQSDARISNVDLADQFTNLIVGQRAFQANARTITVSDEMLQELVNLI